MLKWWGSVRARLTIIVIIASIITLSISALILIEAIELDVYVYTTTDHLDELTNLRNELHDGKTPNELVFPQLRDRTHFSVEDVNGGVIASKRKTRRSNSKVKNANASYGYDHWERTELPVTTDKGNYVLVARTPYKFLDRKVAKEAKIIWAIVGSLICLIGFSTWVVIGKSLQPVAVIVEKVQGITQHTLGERVPETGYDDEIGTLVQTMNKMLGRLENSVKRQRQFVSDASHELRSPVTAIMTEAEVALTHPDVTNTEILANVTLTEGRRLELLIDELLTLARVDEHQTPQHENVQLDLIINKEVDRFPRVPISKFIVSGTTIRGNPDQLSSVVRNLLTNAVRHSNKSVSVRLELSDSLAILAVEDDGEGIDAIDRGRVFNRFTRLEEDRGRGGGGTGLGLALVKEIVESHGGSVRVNKSVLGGACFECRFLLAKS